MAPNCTMDKNTGGKIIQQWKRETGNKDTNLSGITPDPKHLGSTTLVLTQKLHTTRIQFFQETGTTYQNGK